MLLVIAERLQRAVRATDTVSRLGGDEFVVLCPDLKGEDELVEVVERLLAILSEPMEVAGHEVVVSGSVGVSLVQAGSVADLAGRSRARGRRRHVPGQGQRPQRLGPVGARARAVGAALPAGAATPTGSRIAITTSG